MKNITFSIKCSALVFYTLVLSKSLFAQTCGTTISTYPYSEGFETGIGVWTQDTGDNFDWTNDSGGTTSGSTGPSTGHSGSWYMYTEASSPRTTGDIANFESPCFDITNATAAQFSFWRHMYGANMGSLFVELSTDNGTTYPNILWSLSGNQGNSWAQVNIDLAPYLGNTVKIRFRGVRGSDHTGDMAIDDVSVTATMPPGPEIDVQGKGVSIVDGDSTPSILDDTDYGTTNLGIPINKTFTIKNLGTSNLTLSSIVLSNTTDFSITGTPYSTPVAPSGSTTFTVTFNSLSLGSKTSSITIVNNDSNEAIYNFDILAEAEQNFFDSDGDGVFDNIDIDDDNDGIIDSEEQNSCEKSAISITANYKFLNETFGSGNRAMINTTYDATTTYCYEDGAGSGCFNGIDLNDGEYTVYYKAADGDGTNDTPNGEVASWADAYWYTGEDHTTGDTNGRMAMFNASYDPGTFYTANIIGALPNVPITYSFWVLNLDTQSAPGIATRLRPNILVEFRDTSGNVLASITTGDIPPSINGDPANSWHQFTANLTFSVDQFNVFFINNETGGLGNDLAIDDIVISQTLCDTDNDGVADVFDLDADNDGIPDVVEAGLGAFSEGKATLTGVGSWLDVNGNGMHDLVEGNITLDSDGDGTPNFLDLDSDNDAIFDVDESGAGNSGNPTYQNGDGDITGDGVGDGPDSDDIRETDVDSDGTIEYYTDGILDIYDYFNGTDYPTSYGNTNQGLGYTYYVLDTDSDGLPDYMDTTSDGLTFDISHTLYASLDANNDGVIDGPGTVYPNGQIDDAEGDGIIDAFDTSDSTFGSPRDLDRKLHLYFDGRNDYADDTNVIDGWSEATLMAWIKIDPSATGIQIIAGQDEFYLQLNSNKSITAYADGTTISTGASLTTNRWTHIAATYSSSNNTFKLYKNGLEVAITSASGSLPSDTSSFTIGREPDTNSKYYHGYIDELRVFEKALSANEIQKMVYQEIENNSTIVRGAVIPRDITDFVNPSTITPLNWSSLKRYFRMDAYKDDIIDDLTTPTIDVGSGAKIYNTKLIDYQNAPLPFVTQSSGNLDAAVNIPADGVYGNDAALYDWSIVRVEHDDVTFNAHQGHLGLFINELDAGSNPIEYHVTNDSELNVSWYLELNGFIDLEGESQLVQGIDSDLVVGASGKIERDQQGTADTFTYNYWSSPVGIIDEETNEYSYKLPQVMKDGTLNINFITSGYNGTNTSPIGLADYWIWKFANQLDDDYSSWQHVRSTGDMYAGEGFTMKGPGTGSIITDQNYVFSGKPNNGDINLTLSAGNDYLVGNPYPSALDAYEFINDNSSSTTGTLYFWEHWGGGNHILGDYQGGYHLLNLSGATTAATIGSNDPDVGTGGTPVKIPGNYIPVSQGFFVVASGSGGNINFNNGQRIFHKESSGNSTFVGMNNETTEGAGPINNNDTNNSAIADSRLKLRIGFNSVNTIRRQILATVDPNATANIDWGYDGMNNESQMDDMYWLIENDKFVIQGIDAISTQTILPIGIHTDNDGNNSIVLDELENATENFDVFVHDKELNIYHNIKDSDYTIYLAAGEYLDRFEITFSNQDALSTNDEELNKIDVHYSNAIESIVLINPTMQSIKSIEMSNILGQTITDIKNITNENYKEIEVKNLSSGTYIIKLRTDNGTISKKVLVE
jgi:hypothetical protein